MTLLVGGEHYEGNCPCLDGAKLGNAQLPGAQDLQQQGLKGRINFVKFIDQQHAGLSFIKECPQQRPGDKELQRM